MKSLQQLLGMDRETLRARLATDPNALRELRALVAAAAEETPNANGTHKRPRTPADSTTLQPVGGDEGPANAVFGNRGLFETILGYAIVPGSTVHAAIPLLKLAEVSRLWKEVSRASLSVWLPLLKAHAPIGVADGGALVMRWPGGPGGYLMDFVRCSVNIGDRGPDRFWRPDLVLGVEVRDPRDGVLLFVAAGGLEAWDRNEGEVTKTLVAMHAGKGAEPSGPAFAVGQRNHTFKRSGLSSHKVEFQNAQHYFGGFEQWWYKQVFHIRVTAACKVTGRMAMLLEAKSVMFTAVEDRTRDGDVLLILTTKDELPMARLGGSKAPDARVEIRLMSSGRATDAAKRVWTGEPGGGHLIVEGSTIEAVTTYLWSHVL